MLIISEPPCIPIVLQGGGSTEPIVLKRKIEACHFGPLYLDLQGGVVRSCCMGFPSSAQDCAGLAATLRASKLKPSVWVWGFEGTRIPSGQ